jgi:hypothetical protein
VPTYEHPQRYLILGEPANAKTGGARRSHHKRSLRRLVKNVNDHECTAAAGIDWAKDEHALCLIEESGRKILEGRYAHDGRGIAKLCRSLVELGVERVAIERPEGVLVEGLLDWGLIVTYPRKCKRGRASLPCLADRGR